MHRQILEACLPIAIVLIVACGLLNLTIKLSRASWNWKRFKTLHNDQSGGVQSLAMVLTLPIFMAIICMIVQLSQLMIGMMGVHYAAYAGARSASVWVPAHTFSANPGYEETPNHVVIDSMLSLHDPATDQIRGVLGPSSLSLSTKYRKVWTASVLGVAPFCPSLMTEDQTGAESVSSAWMTPEAESLMSDINAITLRFWTNHIAQANTNVLNRRVSRKIEWAKDNTLVFLEWRDAQQSAGRRHHILQGPTYNPWDYTYANGYNNQILFEANEVGWQDPVTVHVYHRFGLMPGLGALLRKVQRSWSFSDRHNDPLLISNAAWNTFMDQGSDENRRLPGVFVIHASATMTNDGLIPIFGEAIDEY